MNIYCKYCKYFEARMHKPRTGECRINPPVFSHTMDKTDWELDCWPLVMDVSWCGKFERKPEE